MKLPLINRFTCSPRQLPFFIDKIKSNQMRPIIDNICENGLTSSKNLRTILTSLDTYPMNTFAIKLSALNLAKDKTSAIDSTYQICEKAVENNSIIIIDAEEVKINNEIDSIADRMMSTFNQNSVNVYKTYQMYRRDTTSKYLFDLNKERDYYLGCKLVRGAYYNQDIDTDLLFWQIKDTHNAYDEAIQHFITYSDNKDKLLCATHNYQSNEIAKNHIHQGKKNIEIGHLLGMADYLSEDLVSEGIAVYKYIPYGEYHETLPYLTRRVYENYPILSHL